jgi:hypothetical protein
MPTARLPGACWGRRFERFLQEPQRLRPDAVQLLFHPEAGMFASSGSSSAATCGPVGPATGPSPGSSGPAAVAVEASQHDG